MANIARRQQKHHEIKSASSSPDRVPLISSNGSSSAQQQGSLLHLDHNSNGNGAVIANKGKHGAASMGSSSSILLGVLGTLRRESVRSFLSGAFCMLILVFALREDGQAKCLTDKSVMTATTTTAKILMEQDETLFGSSRSNNNNALSKEEKKSSESLLRKHQQPTTPEQVRMVVEEESNNNDANSNSDISQEEEAAEELTENTNSNNENDDHEQPSKEWKFFQGDVNQYYNELIKYYPRDPTNFDLYAVHRWLGADRSTQHHYELLLESMYRYTGTKTRNGMRHLRVLDAGCGLGAAMMYMEQKNPTWEIVGRTLSEDQLKFVQEELPPHKFRAELRSFDDLQDNTVPFDAIYSIEAMIHSTDIDNTLRAWATHLHPDHGSLVVIDDFLMPGAGADWETNDKEIQLFAKGWMANALYTVKDLHNIARRYGLFLVEARDLVSEFRVVELNYLNQVPTELLSPDGNRTHQSRLGSKYRHKLTVEGKVGYYMLVFQKMGAKKASYESLVSSTLSSSPVPSTTTEETAAAAPLDEDKDEAECQALPATTKSSVDDTETETTSVTISSFERIAPKDECISSWYCCDKGKEFYDQLKAKRTHKYGFLKLKKHLFGNYMEVFARHLNNLYESLPQDYLASNEGRFLDIGATGSTASGMTQVTTKFQHFAGPLQYWMLDSDVGAKTLNRTIYCDICDCPNADTCGFDVTFSHTVLEHAARPEKAFDTIARLTKKGGLTMHLVPWSYQYHATPDDYYRFSHSALKVLMEDRGFEPLEIGYDLCSKTEDHLTSVDEHYDFIWLTYVVARKK